MVLDFLYERAVEKNKNKQEDFEIQGLWKSEYLLHPNKKERRFHLHYILAQTEEQGCSYYNPEKFPIQLCNSFIGVPALELAAAPLPVKIAALDSVYGMLKDTPDQSFKIKGTVRQKASKRAQIVYSATRDLIERKSQIRRPHKIINVGVVTNIVKQFLGQEMFEVIASDFDQSLIGKKLFGEALVESGEKTLELVAESDVAVITGMTLATETLDAIIQTAKANKTLIVMFAETGANFAREYCNYGIDVVVSEPFPFYLVATGDSFINVYKN